MTCAWPGHLPHYMSWRPLVPPAHRACASRLLVTRALSCSDTCWAVGNTAHIKCFIGVSWSFSLLDEAVCKQFVDSVRLGISACLSTNVQNSSASSANIGLFQAEQPPQSQSQPAEHAGLVDADEFASLSLGKSLGGSPAAAVPASRFPKISVDSTSLLRASHSLCCLVLPFFFNVIFRSSAFFEEKTKQVCCGAGCCALTIHVVTLLWCLQFQLDVLKVGYVTSEPSK